MIYFCYAAYILTLFINILKNKKAHITIVSSFLLIGIMYLFNINVLNHSGGFVGINSRAFLLISTLLTIILIIIKIKYKLNERNVSFIFVIIITLCFMVASQPNFGGLMLKDKEYFEYNLTEWINFLIILLIQCNLCIDFISQKEFHKT